MTEAGGTFDAHSPSLLSLWAGPVQAAHVTDGVVGLGERPEDAEDRVGHHD